MTPKIVIAFCINYPSFTLLSVIFHPFLSFFFFFFFCFFNLNKKINNYLKLNGNSCKIEPTLNVLLLESILVMTVYYFYVSVVFSNVICEIVVVGDQGIN
jgi:hypothetical protein